MRRLALFLLLSVIPLVAAEDPAALVAKLQPAAGWTAPEPARTATHDTLFDLIDGGAELYHEYGFVRAVSWQLENAARSTIQVELYEMNDAPAAFGVWSLMQTGKFTRGTLGQGSLRFGYYVAFWSGPYFASVTGAQPDAATQAEVDRLAAQVAALLPRDGALPPWLETVMPTGGTSVKYFRGRLGLSNIAVSEAAIWFAAGEGLVADHPERQVIVFKYSSIDDAARALRTALGKAPQSAAATEPPSTGDQRSLRLGNGHRISLRVENDCVLLVDTPPSQPPGP